MPRWLHSSMKCAPLSADSLKRIPLLATMPTSRPQIRAKRAHQGVAVELLELVEPAAVDDPPDHLAHVVRRAGVGGHDVVQRLRALAAAPRSRAARVVRAGLGSRVAQPTRDEAPRQRVDDRPHDRQRVRVVVGEVVDDAGGPRVHVAAAELLGGDDLAGRRLHQRRAAEEDRALVAHDHRLVAHRRHVGAACGARAHHAGDLRDPLRREVRLVEEDPAEVLAVGEDLVLHRQERAAGVDEVEAGQPVLQRDGLRPQVLLDRHRVVGAALDRRVVGDHDALAAHHPADAGDDAGARHGVVVPSAPYIPKAASGLSSRNGLPWVEQPVDPVADQELAAVGVLAPRRLAATTSYDGQPLAQLGDQAPQVGGRQLAQPAQVSDH